MYSTSSIKTNSEAMYKIETTLALSNGDFVLKYYENGEYDPSQIKNFIVYKDTIEKLMNF